MYGKDCTILELEIVNPLPVDGGTGNSIHVFVANARGDRIYLISTVLNPGSWISFSANIGRTFLGGVVWGTSESGLHGSMRLANV